MLHVVWLVIAMAYCGWMWPERAWATTLEGAAGVPPGSETHIRYARGLTVESVRGATLITVRGPVKSWSRGGEPVFNEMKVALVPRDIAQPQSLPEGWESAVRIHVPVRRIAVNSQAEEAFLRELGQEAKLVAVGGNKSYDDRLRARVLAGEVGQIGYSWHSPPNLDVLLVSKPDVFVMRLSDLDHAPSLKRANDLGLPTMPYFIDAETTYLGRAEWIKLFGLLTGTEARANALFEEIKRSSEAVRSKASELPAVPLLWAYPVGRDRWFAVVRGVEAELLQHAGALNLLRAKDNVMEDAEHEVSTESLLVRGITAERWIINDSHAVTVPNSAILERIPAFLNGKLYTNNGRAKPELDAFDQYERGFVRPDLVLKDLYAVVHERSDFEGAGYIVPFDKSRLVKP